MTNAFLFFGIILGIFSVAIIAVTPNSLIGFLYVLLSVICLRIWWIYRTKFSNELKKLQFGPLVNPPRAILVIFNDDVTLADHVIQVLERNIPGMTSKQARTLTWKIHNNGAAVVWSGSKIDGESHYRELKETGLKIFIYVAQGIDRGFEIDV